MKTLFLLFLSTLAFADDGDFAKHKSEMLQNIDERIQKMTEHKNCVSAAADKDALRKCHEAKREWHKEEMKDKREKRMERMQNRLEKMKDKAGKPE